MAGACVYCGAQAVHRHHPTGRSAPGASYCDASLTVWLCRSCHVAEHSALRRLGLDFPGEQVDLVTHRVLRAGALALRCADLRRPLVVEPEPARALGALLVEVSGVIRLEVVR